MTPSPYPARSPAWRRAVLCLPLLTALGACSWGYDTVRLSGAETASVSGRTNIVPAALTRVQGGAQMELVTADGVALAGLLREEQEPVVVPLASTGAPLVGGATLLAGDIAGGGTSMSCRFRLLNPVRGADGGGAGRCEGGARQVDFVF